MRRITRSCGSRARYATASGEYKGEQTVIELHNDQLLVSFPELHPDARCAISFQRTLRIPDDNRTYPLPAGLGRFPLQHVDDFANKVPGQWLEHGGVLFPMYQSEAMWIHFGALSGYPFAIKIAAGKINAVSGADWTSGLERSPQNYLVVPGQPWLDGFSVQKGLIRQFVAMPLGEGFTAEEQLTGKASHGGVQIGVFPMRRDRYDELIRRQESRAVRLRRGKDFVCLGLASESMGLAPGGLMRQEIYKDRHGLDAWDTARTARCFVHLVNSATYREITGCAPPMEPIGADRYREAGIPWFEYYGGDAQALEGAPRLAEFDSVAAKTIKKSGKSAEPIVLVDDAKIVKLRPRSSGTVREGTL
jgi:hypothetical protein